MKYTRLLVLVLCVVFFGVSPGMGLRLENATTTADNLHDIELEVQQEVNQVREIAKIPQLNWDEKLATEARRHAKNMAVRDFFSHTDPALGDVNNRLDRSGIEWMRCAENLFLERGFSNPAKRAVQTWLDSPGHRKNMLDSKFSETGVGIAVRKDKTIVVVQEYIYR